MNLPADVVVFLAAGSPLGYASATSSAGALTLRPLAKLWLLQLPVETSGSQLFEQAPHFPKVSSYLVAGVNLVEGPNCVRATCWNGRCAKTMYDRMSIKRTERQGNAFIVTLNYTFYLGPVWASAPYHEVHGINLGKLPAGNYMVKWMIGSFSRDIRTEELKSPGGWQELKRSFNVLALKVREK